MREMFPSDAVQIVPALGKAEAAAEQRTITQQGDLYGAKAPTRALGHVFRDAFGRKSETERLVQPGRAIAVRQHGVGEVDLRRDCLVWKPADLVEPIAANDKGEKLERFRKRRPRKMNLKPAPASDRIRSTRAGGPDQRPTGRCEAKQQAEKARREQQIEQADPQEAPIMAFGGDERRQNSAFGFFDNKQPQESPDCSMQTVEKRDPARPKRYSGERRKGYVFRQEQGFFHRLYLRWWLQRGSNLWRCPGSAASAGAVGIAGATYDAERRSAIEF
jgi:hypothetical protein